MFYKVLRISALVPVIALAVGMTLNERVSAIFQSHQPSSSRKSATSNERKVLYWYDAMTPQHHYSKPGKAPDGMDLVPQYAEDNLSQGAGTTSGSRPAGERKILFWYDPMHPAYKSDKPGIAPDCGMQLVPKYAEDETAKMPAGTVKIAPEKQQMIGVRTAIVERQSLARTVRTTGQLTSDETKLAHIHVKVTGYIDKVTSITSGNSSRRANRYLRSTARILWPPKRNT